MIFHFTRGFPLIFPFFQGHLLLHALRPGAPTHFADLAKAYEMLPPETQDGVL